MKGVHLKKMMNLWIKIIYYEDQWPFLKFIIKMKSSTESKDQQQTQ